MRWKIEVFHNILKSGYRAEQTRLRTAERLVKLLAVFCILSWRVFWLTMLNRAEPDLVPTLVLTNMEMAMLDPLIPGPMIPPRQGPPQGNMVILWRGLSRLNDITLGTTLKTEIVGN